MTPIMPDICSSRTMFEQPRQVFLDKVIETGSAEKASLRLLSLPSKVLLSISFADELSDSLSSATCLSPTVRDHTKGHSQS